jgi:hypothetical protein
MRGEELWLGIWGGVCRQLVAGIGLLGFGLPSGLAECFSDWTEASAWLALRPCAIRGILAPSQNELEQKGRPQFHQPGRAPLFDQRWTPAVGISSHVRPLRRRPLFFLFVPPHCLKKKGTPVCWH